MIFLIEYDRPQGRIITLKTFEDSEMQTAENTRLDLELKLNRSGTDHEVVLLEAASKDALLKTHRRYFENLSQIVNSTTSSDV